MGSVLNAGYPVVPDAILAEYMQRYLATAEGQATAQQFAGAGVNAWFLTHEMDVQDDISGAVAAYLQANPPAAGPQGQPGAMPSAAQIQQAVDAYIAAHPPAPGATGATGPAGESVTPAQVAAAVAAYLQANPPQPGATGPAGQNATDAQVAAAVASYLTTNPLTAAVAAVVASYLQANPPAKGDRGPPGSTLLGTVTIGQASLLSVAGMSEFVAPLAGAVPGGRYLAFCDSHKLNGGASQPGRPAGYGIIDATCRTAGQIIVFIQRPALTVLQSFSLTVPIFQMNA